MFILLADTFHNIQNKKKDFLARIMDESCAEELRVKPPTP